MQNCALPPFRPAVINGFHPRKYQSMRFLAIVIASLALTFVGSSLAASSTTIRATDAGHLVRLRVGEELLLYLECNPSTGYDWFLTDTKEAVLRSLGKPPCRQNQSKPGAGGIESWNFRATN
jgi:inhibitor of cysteine peptidase